jgi:hypothetical protein
VTYSAVQHKVHYSLTITGRCKRRIADGTQALPRTVVLIGTYIRHKHTNQQRICKYTIARITVPSELSIIHLRKIKEGNH